MYHRMSDDMDVDCGGIVDGSDTVAEAGERIFSELLAVASGRRTRSEEHGYGDDAFVPWQVDTVM